MKHRFPQSHHRAKATIKACVESGAGIEYLPDAPRFRYTPAAERSLHNGPPSSRGYVSVDNADPHKLRNWSPTKLSLNPMYGTYLRGTSAEEHDAKASWAKGDPNPLREFLAGRPWLKAA